MRTTLTIDEDVVAKLRAEMRRRGVSFKELVNETLRVGLESQGEMSMAGPFKVKPRALGQHPGLDYDNVGELLERVEGPAHQ